MASVAPKQTGKLLLKLLLKPRPKPVEQNKLDFLAKAQNFSFQKHNQTYRAYHWIGEGPSILLMHGWESNSSRWRPLIKKLQKLDYNIYALDAPGHGNSEGSEFTPIKFAEAAQHVIHEKEIEILLGHSAGAYAALYLLSALPNTIKHVVALAPTYSMEDVFAGMQSILLLNDKAIEALRKYFIEVYDVIPKEFSSLNFVQKINIPALLIHDEQDQTLPVNGSDKVAKVWENCTYKRTSGYGHRLRNAEVDNLILDFLALQLK